ncbi:hypothetical protein DFJ58DRAFT_797088 [Suillus subalutaceus]|uniref:uncharacterized protein n=1 Tax=Suillus subalutaceus TaxID=48586 RepID=UPI001B870E11|nr:uncharacterized protein DFJ58DRAFT_797088 [Suillus subalutaceus]KAG1847846.1 hypothetical protein DFJ58DRAFT_797088 [Suillus subalutaceus]
MWIGRILGLGLFLSSFVDEISVLSSALHCTFITGSVLTASDSQSCLVVPVFVLYIHLMISDLYLNWHTAAHVTYFVCHVQIG